MLKLIFFTTNKTKLAHARYLADEYPIRIEGFRQKTYHASYSEPHIESREELLESSYQSALKQAQKAKIDASRRFFFLEDTSVVIDAISTSSQEVPGVDVKYWMKSQTFKSLDNLLKDQGNNRKVTVQSDILLHVPDSHREEWALTEPYIIFTGFQDGTIAEQEYPITTNLVFPWLDNKTFNKWFVPNGASMPISLLPIEEADSYDFRRHAFSKMVEFLKKKGALTEEQKQMSLALDIVPTLIVCGFTCAGKTTISQYLIEKYAYLHIEASDFMHLNYYLRHDVSSKIEIGDFAEEALEVRPRIAAEKITEYMAKNSNLPIVISGFRSKNEIDWLIDYYGNSKDFVVVFIHASEETRFERYNKRKRDGKVSNLQEFGALDKQQVRMGLNEIAEHSNSKHVENEKSFEKFYEAFEKDVLSGHSQLKGREIDLSRFHHFDDNIRLGDAILVALLSKWEDDEDRDYYTTAMIAKLIAEVFPALKPKHKDNVSRHFNQDFYAFYDIKPNPDENKRRYRLSNTGHSRAIQVYHELTRDGEFGGNDI